MTNLPQTMRAVTHVGKGLDVEVKEKAVPQAKGKQVLVRVRVIGQNPTDYKHAQLFSKDGNVMGCDAAGEVAALGDDVPSDAWKVGDRVAGFVRGGISDNGSFAEYFLIDYDNLFRIPQNISFESAASMPIPAFTAIQGLYLRLGLPEPGSKGASNEWILVWSASSAVGQYVIQLAKLSGLKVVGTASKARWEHLKSLGADELVDYKDSDAIEQIKKITGDSLRYAFDCVTNDESTALCQKAMSPGGGKVVVVLFPDADKMPRKDVEIIRTLAYTYLYSGGEVAFGPAKFEAPAKEHQHYVSWLKNWTGILESGQVKPIPTKSHGGLEDVAAGFKFMNEGRNAAYKMVYSVA